MGHDNSLKVKTRLVSGQGICYHTRLALGIKTLWHHIVK